MITEFELRMRYGKRGSYNAARRKRDDEIEYKRMVEFYMPHCNRPACSHKETFHENAVGACLVEGCGCPKFLETVI